MSMPTDQFRVDGRAAIVTAASRGIGAECAATLAAAGADVLIAARDEDALASVAERVQEHGRRAVTVSGDLTDLDHLVSLVDRAVSAFGRLDVVVNNLGGALPRPFLDTKARHLESAFHMNVSTAFELTRAATPHLLESGHGSVVNITSAMGRLRDRGYSVYATVKGALAHLTRQLAADLAPRVRVNAVAPGSVETEALGSVLNDEMRATMISMTPMRRLGRPEDIALAVLYLASDASSYMTGKVLEVDGGIEAPNLPLGLPDL
ncbi:MAG TPA: SDR family oxidoreductase [Acidimicrobiales bacterium]|nr:SDR family oxidoreductase [Acidimicrobiales bacterium]